MKIAGQLRGGCLHHVSLNSHLYNFDQVRQLSHRIQCLRLYLFSFNVTSLCWPNLTRLQLGHSRVSISDLTAANFPSLKHLAFHYIEPGQNDADWSPPALQSLRFIANWDPAWIKRLHACQRSLLSLDFRITGKTKHLPSTKLCLPKLRCLCLFDDHWVPYPIDLTTPALGTYFQHQVSYQLQNSLLHKDLHSVTYVCIQHVPTLSVFPRLRTLHLSIGPSNAHFEIIQRTLREMYSSELQAAQESMDR